ncbi:hypothetical protein C8R46DRAFT_1048234 [Mycena filopes]|nr:hypothetical protein C8R46DRAFT_1048234 [Mycena filopes]
MAVDSTEFTPSELKTYCVLCLLGEMFDALLDPFINPTLSLSEQLIKLVKFAHLICAMFIKHESAFISNQLYGDLQCMVKNTIFKIAHSKILNPYLKVFLCLLGDDVLETLFGRTRMIGGHSPNMAIDEFRQRVGSALRMDKIFRKYPWLEHRALRLNMVRGGNSRGLWVYSRFAAEDVDLMRPKGGKYPGVSKDVDRSMPDNSRPAVSDKDQSDINDILKFDAEAVFAAEKAVRDAELAAQPEGHSIWIKLDGNETKKVHKKSILRTLMDPTFDIDNAKSHDRLLRIRCYSVGGDHFDRAAAKIHNNINNEHLLKLHGLFATLVSFDTSRVALAVLQCTLIKITNKNPPTYLDSAPIAEIALAETQYETFNKEILNVTVAGSNELREKMWVFSDTQMANMCSVLLERAQEEEVRLKIPVHGPVRKGCYPYEATVSNGPTKSCGYSLLRGNGTIKSKSVVGLKQ